MGVSIQLYLILSFIVFAQGTNETDTSNGTRILSRRKRFLIFPEGSSLQLEIVETGEAQYQYFKLKRNEATATAISTGRVFCTTYPMISFIGDIILWGNTAALAYELPQDPYSPFMHRADPLHRRMDTKTIYYTDYDGNIIHKEPYKRKPIVNPAFAKRSVEEINRKQMHKAQTREFLKAEDERSVAFHSSSRVALYRQIEVLLEGLGTNGRSCLLKVLCEMGQTQDYKQGSFVQEILRATFTLPNSPNSQDMEYHSAHFATQRCADLYSDCGGPLVGLNAPLAAN